MSTERTSAHGRLPANGRNANAAALTIALRCEQIAEGLAHLEAVFAEPGSQGDCSVADAAESLASEFIGAYRDDEVTGRLAKLIEAETAGRPKEALRHLRFASRKIMARWSLHPESGGTTVQPDDVAAAS